MNAHFALVIAILSEVIGTPALKACDGFSRFWPSLIVAAGYGLALIVGISWLVFRQALARFARHLWVPLTIAGGVVLNVFSKASTR